MPDHDIDELFTTFRTGGRLVIPPGPAAARQVSRRRHRRRNALTGAVVALLVAVPIIGYGLFTRGLLTWDPNGRVGGTPTASTSSASPTPSTTTPSATEPTDVPAATVLQASDLPAGYVHQGDIWPGDTTFNECSVGGRSDGLPASLTLPIALVWRATWFRADIPTSGESGLVNEMVSRYTAADASSYMDTIRGIVAYCGGSWVIGAGSFAGDDSFTIHNGAGPTLTTYIFVRTGSLVAQVLYEAIDDTDPVVIGQRAAERLCAGTTAC
jgi:hypothetical protein